MPLFLLLTQIVQIIGLGDTESFNLENYFKGRRNTDTSKNCVMKIVVSLKLVFCRETLFMRNCTLF